MTLKIFGRKRHVRTPKELWQLAEANGITRKAEDFLVAMTGAFIVVLSGLLLYLCLVVMFL